MGSSVIKADQLNNALKIILFGLLALVLVLGNAFLFSKKTSLEKQLSQMEQLEKRMQAETESLSKEKSKLTDEKEKLQADAASYLSGNEKLQKEKETLNTGLEKAQKLVETKEAESQRLKESLKKIEKKIAREHAAGESKSEEEAKKMQKRLYERDEKIKKENAVYHYNLAVALTEAKHYDAAIAEYEKALALDPNNAEAHYNLGLIYDDINDDANKAVFHYRAYLKLRPKAADRDEVERAIKNLKT